MPIEVGVWKLGKQVEQVRMRALERESELEDALVANLGRIGPGLRLVGRQASTDHGAFIDIVAIDHEGEGAFAKLRTACQLRSRFTIERVLKHFRVEDDA